MNDAERERNFELYPPGSKIAGEHGCICPVLDNEYGAGAYVKDGVPQYWTRPDCPLHGNASPSARTDAAT